MEWYDGNVGLALDQTDLAIVEQALSGMRTLTKDEHRLLDASRAAEKQRQADETERQRKSAQEVQARLDAERTAKEATEQRLKDQEAFNKKLIRVLAGLAAVVIIAIGAGIYAEVQRSRAQKQSWISDAQRLAAQSVVERQGSPSYPQRSFLLAVEAIRATLDHGQPIVPAAEQALHDCFAAVQGRFLADHGALIWALAFAPDGRLVTAGLTARVWDLEPKLIDLASQGGTITLGVGPRRPTIIPDIQGSRSTPNGCKATSSFSESRMSERPMIDLSRLVNRPGSAQSGLDRSCVTGGGRNLTLAEWDQFFKTGIDDYHQTFKNHPEGKGVAEMRKASAAGPAINGSIPASTPAASGAVTK